jgi:hypothetical protein
MNQKVSVVNGGEVFTIHERNNRMINHPAFKTLKTWKLNPRGYIHVILAQHPKKPWVLLGWTNRRQQKSCEQLKFWNCDGQSELDMLQLVSEVVSNSKFVFGGVRTMQRRPRDIQKVAVYKWEDKCLGWQNQPMLSQLEVKNLVHRIAKEQGIIVNKIGFKRNKNGGSHACSGDGQVVFHVSHMRNVIVCHEMAHLIADNVHGFEKIQGHGPTYMRIYVDLLVKYCGYNERDLLRSIWENGIRIAK